ncbi:syntaxin-1A-like [Halichondria panicea]|uniref:syntaxin-1A-like n=1 Tax=Halichondria panicea TaxID=6063 RepID=UPI00312B66C3
MAIAMTDRLYALKGRGGSGYGQLERSETGNLGIEEEDTELNKVLSTVDEVTAMINRVVALIEKVRGNHGKILTSFQNQTAREQNEQFNEEIKTLSHKVHNQLKRMKVDLDGVESGPTRNSADFRIRKAQYTTLSRRFKDVMEDYNGVQENYRDKNKDRIQKQLQYAGRNVTEDEVDDMLESDNPQIFTQDLLLERKSVLGEVETRHQEIMQLETNIRELHDMFYDMALLVDEQGELINVIERNVENAGVYANQGRKEIRKAVVYHESNRKLRWCICCCVCSVLIGLLIVAAIIGVIVYFLVIQPMQGLPPMTG